MGFTTAYIYKFCAPQSQLLLLVPNYFTNVKVKPLTVVEFENVTGGLPRLQRCRRCSSDICYAIVIPLIYSDKLS